MTIRPARAEDDAALAALDRATWSALSSPIPAPPPGRPFFSEQTAPQDVLVAEDDLGAVVGYVAIGPAIPVAAARHVLELKGLAVDPAARGAGVGRALVEAAVREAGARGARRLNLRVLAPNAAARGLYAACGFEVHGVLPELFELEGRYVDDVLMGRRV